jgi:hypothetical protein
MNAVDVTARGLARRALDTGATLASPQGAAGIGTADGTDLQTLIDKVRDGAVNIAAREPTAASLEALAAESAVITGYAGATHTVETAPYLARSNLVIHGNGATLKNTNQTGLDTDEWVSSALFLGTSILRGTDALPYYPITSTRGPMLVSTGNGDKFAVGDPVVVRGASGYTADDFVPRNSLRAIVCAQTADTITLDRMLPAELLADRPEIANARAGADFSPFRGAPQYYLSIRPNVANLTLASDIGAGLNLFGVIDGVFRDIRSVGRNGLVANALQDCLVDRLRFQAWRKGIEMSEGSYGTIVRNVRGSLSDASERYGGASDAPPFFIGINENSEQCTIEDIHFDSGPNDLGATCNACQLASGRKNGIRDFDFRFPAHTGVALSIQSNGTAGNSADEMTYERGQVYAPACKTFLTFSDGGAGLDKPRAIDLEFTGILADRAVTIGGTNGLMERCRYESGDVSFAPAVTGWRIQGNEFNGSFTFPATFANNRIVGNYIKKGFTNLTGTLLKNNVIADNESDASRRLSAAAVVVDAQSANITATLPNTAYQTAVFAAGDLAVGDRIIIYSRLTAGGNGGGGRNAAIGVSTPIAGRKGCGSRVVTAMGSLNVEAELVVVSDTIILYHTTIGGIELGPSSVVVDSLAANPLTVTVEAWVSGSDPVVPYGCRIIPVKPGMRHLDLR